MTLIVVDSVNDLSYLKVAILLVNSFDMRNYIFVELVRILVHVVLDFFLSENDWLLDFVQVLHLLDLVDWKLVLGRIENAFITEQFLSLLLCDDLFW